MTDTLIKVDLTKSPTDNENIHNRWHPDIPMACWVNPGDDFILETFDWTGGFIKNNDSADDVRDIDLSTVHYLSGPVGVKGAEPGDLLVVDLLDIGAKQDSLWGFNGFFSKKNGGGFLTDHFPEAQKSIWDFKGMFTSSRHVPGVNFAAEDPFVWYDYGRRKYEAIVKDNEGHFTHAGKSLALWESEDGFEWKLGRHALVAKTEIRWADGRTQKLNSLERPQLMFGPNGQPQALLCAVDETSDRTHSFNVRIPLQAGPAGEGR